MTLTLCGLAACATPSPKKAETSGAETPVKSALKFSTTKFRSVKPLYSMPQNAEAKTFLEWQSRTQEIFKDTLKIPVKSTASLSVKILEKETSERFLRQKIAYTLEAGFRIHAYLYLPKDKQAPRPAILIWHGHSDGGKEAVAGNPPFIESKDLHRAAAAKLASNGYVVLAPDLRSFGESGSWYEHRILCGTMLIHGQNLVGQMIADGMRGIDVLSEHPQVDSKKIAVGGLGIGAQIAVYQAIVDPRVKAVIAQAFLMNFKHAFLRSQHDVCQYIPSLAKNLDLPDIAALLAPRATLYVNGHNDHMFPMNDVNFAYDQVYKVYTSLGAAESVLLHRHPYANYWVHDATLTWLEKVFGKL